jgi:hypothetical protein
VNPHYRVPAVEQVGLAPAGRVAAVLDEPVPVASTGEGDAGGGALPSS